MRSQITPGLLCIFAIPLLLILLDPAWAQDCTPTNISLSTQSQVDNFQQEHGPCDLVTGELSIVGNDITNLDGLSELAAVEGDLFISDSPLLASVSGLKSLTRVGGTLTFQANNSLGSFDGLRALKSIDGSFFIFRNDELTNLNGLSSLDSVGNRFYISSNPALANVDGIDALGNIGGILRIWDNSSLGNLDGFSSLSSVHSHLEITSNALLANLDGLANLHSVHGDLLIGRNDSLVSVGGLSNLESDIGILSIYNNPAITNLDGLGALTRVGQLSISQNASLSDCLGVVKLIDPIDDGEQGHAYSLPNAPDVGSYLILEDNLFGCNSVNEVLSMVPISSLNAGFNDAWFNMETSGQGFLITVFPEIEKVFIAWFTFDTERPPGGTPAILGAPGQRWMTAQGDYTEDLAELTLYVTVGGVFDSEEPTPDTEPYGELAIEFDTCNSGTIFYDIPSIFQQGEVQVERVSLDNVPLCYLLDNQETDSNTENE